MARTRVLWALLAIAIVGGPVVWTLQSPGAPDRAETPIPPILDHSGNPLPIDPVSIPFTRISPWGEEQIHEMALHVPVPVDLMRHVEIRLMFYQSDKKERHPASGRIEIVGTPCVFEMQPDAEINDGREQVFIRQGRCLPGDGRPTGELTLTVKMGGPGSLGLYTRTVPENLRGGGLIYIAERGDGIATPAPAVMGSYLDDLPDFGWRRINLLSYVWTGSVTPTRAWLFVAGLLLVMVVGVLLFPSRPSGPDDPNRSRLALTTAAAAFCLASALALLYATFIPPFQAADENFYVSSYSELVGGSMFDDMANWARRTHFDRIRADSRQQFRPRDIGQPRSEIGGWAPAPLRERSSLTATLWSQLAGRLPAMGAAPTFAAVRGVSALVFGLTVALSAALLVLCCPVRYPQLLCFPFLLVPSLPFFGMQFSEAALLTSASVAFAASLTVLFIDGPRAHYAGLPLGLSAAALLLATRSGLPMAMLLATALLARVALGTRGSARAGRDALIFWAGVAAGLGLLHLLANEAHLARIGVMLSLAGNRLPGPLSALTGWALTPWALLVIGLGGWALEIALAGARGWAAASSSGMRRALQVAGVGAAAAIVASLAGSIWWDYPDVSNIQSDTAAPLGVYVKEVMSSAAGVFRLRHHSLYMSSSFWAGFGWLDTIPGEWFITLLVTAAAISTIGLLLHVRHGARRSLWLWLFLSGSIGTLALYAFSAKQINTNLHGRYLIGWYASALAIAWTWPALARGGASRRPLIMVAAALAVHAYALCFIARRYF